MNGGIVLNGSWEGTRFGDIEGRFLSRGLRKPVRVGESIIREQYEKVYYRLPKMSGHLEDYYFWVLTGTDNAKIDQLVDEYYNKIKDRL